MHLHHAPRCRSPPMHHTPCTMTTVSFATHDLVSHNGNPRPRLIVHSSRLMHHAPRCRSPPMHHAPCTIHHAPCITVLFATHVPCTTVLFVSHDLVGHHKHKHTQHTPTPPPPPHTLLPFCPQVAYTSWPEGPTTTPRSDDTQAFSPQSTQVYHNNTHRSHDTQAFHRKARTSLPTIFLIDLFVGTYRLSSHARLDAFVIQTKLTITAKHKLAYLHVQRHLTDHRIVRDTGQAALQQLAAHLHAQTIPRSHLVRGE